MSWGKLAPRRTGPNEKAQRGVQPINQKQVASGRSLLHSRSWNDLGSNAGFCGERTEQQRGGSITKSISSCFLSSLFNSCAGFLLFNMTNGGKSNLADCCSLPALNTLIIEERQRIMILDCHIRSPKMHAELQLHCNSVGWRVERANVSDSGLTYEKVHFVV